MSAATALERVLGALERAGCHHRLQGGQYSALCPAHEDRNPSMTVRNGDGKVLLHCHVGCTTEQILAALRLDWPDLFDQRPEPDQRLRPEIVATYDYRDAEGSALFQKLRYLPKGFRVRRPDGRGGWQWGIGDAERVLYRLPEVLAAVVEGRTVYIVEGEKDADRLTGVGHVGTCNFDGAAKEGQRAKWRSTYSDTLAGAHVVIIADNDAPGYAHARAVATSLRGKAASVTLVRPAVDHAGADVSDHLNAGHRLADLVPIDLDPAPPPDARDGAPGDEPAPAEEPADKTAKSASTRLVQIAEELYEFGISDSGETFGVPRCGPKVLRLLRGGKTSLRAQLTREYFRRHAKAAPAQALADALLVVEGIAQDSDERTLHLRVATHDGVGWLDLGDATGRAVAITGTGWTVQPSPPVLFKRTTLMSPLPGPARGADLAELWRWLNITGADQPLLAAWLVAALFAGIPHPILSISGEQGTGKSTAEKVLVSILDPSPVPIRKPPRDADSWVTAAAGSWVVGLDNLSEIPPWLSDSLCRAVTGDGDVRRKLYTDGDMAVFSFRRCLILNGIDLGALRGDLADRLLPVALDVINEESRLPETELWPRWEQAHPRILGAVLDLMAGVTAALPSVHLAKKPRMADFARVLAAVDDVLGTAGLPRYLAKQAELATESLTDDLFVSVIGRRITGTFAGSSADLLGHVSLPEGVRAPKEWPTTARQATRLLRRQAPVMRKAGWMVHDDGGRNKDGVLRWTITPPSVRDGPYPPPPSPPSPPSAPDMGSCAGDQAGMAGQDGYLVYASAASVSAAQPASGGDGGDGGGGYGPSLTEGPDSPARHRPEHPRTAELYEIIGTVPDIAGTNEHHPRSETGPDTDSRPCCTTCGQPLLLNIPGRTRCERCRIRNQTAGGAPADGTEEAP